jgi:hypothetical protein
MVRATAAIRLTPRASHPISVLSIAARQPQHLAVEVHNLMLDSLTCFEQRAYRGGEFWASRDELGCAHGKHVHLCPPDDEPKILEQPTNLVLKIAFDLNEQRLADEEGLDRVTVEVFDTDFFVPPTLHNACNAPGIVTAALVDLRLQRCLCGLASMQITGSPILFRSVQSHVDVAPVSSPMRCRPLLAAMQA